MNKKRLTICLIAFVLVGLIAVGGSLAWFTDSKDSENVFTTNHVEIELTETNWEKNKVYMPGATIKKNPKVILAQDSSNAYVRIKNVTLVVNPADGRTPTKLTYSLEELGVDIDDNWVKGTDGNYYYQLALTKEKPESTELFTSITIPGVEWTNEYVGATVTIDIQAEAIQADNFKPVIENGKIVNWGDTGTIQPYVVTNNED